MTREDVFTLIQNHLADELEVDASRIEEGTRFKEDLEADSLDLYTLVQELEDSYGVKMSDEQAAAWPSWATRYWACRSPRTSIRAWRPSATARAG
jgi:acyl carrier protein